MPRIYKVKCRVCGKKLTSDKAYKVTEGKSNKYYCNQQEYEEMTREKETKDKCYKYMEELMKVSYSAIARKKINMLHEHYCYQVIYRAIKSAEKGIRFAVENKSFNNENAMVSYLLVIITNDINKIDKQYKKEQEDLMKLFEEPKNNIDIDILNSVDDKPKGKPKVSDISEWLIDD